MYGMFISYEKPLKRFGNNSHELSMIFPDYLPIM